MNEQIKEFMQQAGTDTSGKWMGIDHAEKFAELIIQDLCAKLEPVLAQEIRDFYGVDK